MFILYVVFLLAAVTAWLLFRRKGKANPPATRSFDATDALLQEHVAFYRKLNNQQKDRFALMAGNFLDEVRIEGVGT